MTPRSTTSSWTAASSSCTPRPRPNRCWWPGASTPTASPASWGWAQGRPSRPTPGGRCWPTSKTAGSAPRCWSSFDGGKGLGTAIERSFLHSLHQRCLVHVCRNLIAKVPTHAQDQVKRDYWAIFDHIEQDSEAARAEGRRRAKRFITKWRPLYPAAVACVADHLEALLAHLLFPAEHRKRIRHANLIERTFGETRRRVKVIGRLPGEHSCLSLIWAVLDRASKGWRG